MNETRAQRVILDAVALDSLKDMLGSVGMGLLSGAVGLGLASVLKIGQQGGEVLSKRRFWHWLSALLAAGAGGWAMIWFIDVTLDTHDCFRDPLTYWVLPSVAGLAVGCLFLMPPRVNWGCIGAGVGSLSLVALYRGMFDYYFADLLFFGLAAGLWNPSKRPIHEERRAVWEVRTVWRLGKVCMALLIAAVFVWTGRSWIRLVVDQNRTAALIQMYEKALDENLIQVSEVGTAPFGYLGWIYSDCYSRGLKEGQGRITGFLSLAQGWDGEKGTGVLMNYPKPFNSWKNLLPTRNNMALKASEGRIIMQTEFPIFGSYKATFILKQVRTEEVRDAPMEGGCERVSFPIHDADWRKLLLKAKSD